MKCQWYYEYKATDNVPVPYHAFTSFHNIIITKGHPV